MAAAASAARAIPNARDVREVESDHVNYAIHPLVLMNVSEHHTRLSLQNPSGLAPAPPGGKSAPASASAPLTASTRAIGILLGQQNGRKLEIHTSFDLKVTGGVPGEPASSINVLLDAAYMKKKRESMLRVFPDYEVVGWYTTGVGLSEHDLTVTHNAICEVAAEGTTTMVILIVNLTQSPTDKSTQLPVYLFEATRAADGAAAPTISQRISYTVESEESERIGVETARLVDTATETEIPTLKPQAEGFKAALTMLRARINVIVAYLEAVQAGKIPPDYALLRRISTIVNQMPRSDNPSFQVAFHKDYNEAMVVAYLGLLQKGTMMLGKLSVDVHEAASGAGGDRRGAKRTMGF